LILTQADRALQQYKPLIDREEELQIGKDTAEAVARDRQAVFALEIALKSLKGRPQGFNGPAGFLLFEWLDDADRNVLLCATGALAQSTSATIEGDANKAVGLFHLFQTCEDASALLYTVSESAGALYERYVEAENQLAEESVEAAQTCVKILKKNDIAPKK
jgi:hypothetical protein